MTQEAFAGLAILGVSSVGVGAALLRGEILTNWPLKPIRRDRSPEAFWAYIIGFCGAGTFGAMLLLAAFIRRE